MVLVFGAPITFFPLPWARVIGWTIPDDVRLTRYFGRCLGLLVLSLCGLALYASVHPEIQSLVCMVAGITMLGLSLIHIVGALEKAQPFFETLEIGIYGCAGGYFLWLALGVQ